MTIGQSEPAPADVATDPGPAVRRIPRGYVPALALSSFGTLLAVLGPTIGGLSVKVQNLVGLDAAPAQLGLLSGVGLFFALLTQPIAGRLSDRCVSRFGMRRPFIVIGVAGMFVALVGCGLAPNMPVLMVTWCVAQTFGNVAFAAQNATVADQVPEPKRGGVSGVLGAATPMSLLGGAVLISAMPNDFLRFLVPALIGVATATVFVIVLKDRVRAGPPTTPLNLRQLLLSFVFDPRKHPDFGWALLSRMLILVGYGSVGTYLTLYLGTAYGMDTKEQLAFNAIAQVVGVGTLVVFSVVGGFLSDRVGRRKPFIVVSGVVVAIGVAGVASGPLFGDAGLTVILVAEAVMGMGAGCFFAVDQALCLSLLPNPDDTAKDLGVLNTAATLPGSISPLLAGLVFIPLGNAAFDGGGYVLWFAVGAVFAIIGAILILRVRQAT